MAHRYFDPVREEVEKELEERRKRVGEGRRRVRDRRKRRLIGLMWEFSWMFVEKDRWMGSVESN